MVTVVVAVSVIVVIVVIVITVRVVIVFVDLDDPFLAARADDEVLDLRAEDQLVENRDAVFIRRELVPVLVLDCHAAGKGVHAGIGQMRDDCRRIRHLVQHVVAEGGGRRIFVLGVVEEFFKHVLADLVADTDHRNDDFGQVAPADRFLELFDVLANLLQVVPFTVGDDGQEGLVDLLAGRDAVANVVDESPEGRQELGGVAEFSRTHERGVAELLESHLVGVDPDNLRTALAGRIVRDVGAAGGIETNKVLHDRVNGLVDLVSVDRQEAGKAAAAELVAEGLAAIDRQANSQALDSVEGKDPFKVVAAAAGKRAAVHVNKGSLGGVLVRAVMVVLFHGVSPFREKQNFGC